MTVIWTGFPWTDHGLAAEKKNKKVKEDTTRIRIGEDRINDAESIDISFVEGNKDKINKEKILKEKKGSLLLIGGIIIVVIFFNMSLSIVKFMSSLLFTLLIASSINKSIRVL